MQHDRGDNDHFNGNNITTYKCIKLTCHITYIFTMFHVKYISIEKKNKKNIRNKWALTVSPNCTFPDLKLLFVWLNLRLYDSKRGHVNK